MERLSIDEVIEHCERKTVRYEQLNGKAELERADISLNFIKEYWEHRQVVEWLEQLKSYKDAEEQGLLLRLPCKVGSELYVIRKLCDGKETRVIENVIANSFDLRALQRFVITSNGHRLNFSNFGKTAFLTREEAERALAEMK